MKSIMKGLLFCTVTGETSNSTLGHWLCTYLQPTWKGFYNKKCLSIVCLVRILL